MASAHPRVLAALGRALSLELTAVQQYLTHASLLEAWGDQAGPDPVSMSIGVESGNYEAGTSAGAIAFFVYAYAYAYPFMFVT